MKWNWQKDEWPEFRYDPVALAALESEFLASSGVLLGVCKHLDQEQFDTLRVELVSEEALKTSAIEGEFLNRDSLQSSIRRQFGLPADHHKIPPAEEGVAQMMVEVYRSWNAPLSDDAVFNWHSMLTLGRRDLVDMGQYRTTAEPMQVVSGALDRRTIHFEAPPSNRVGREMAMFNEWFNRTAPGGSSVLPALTRAGMAHLYFVCIHPFEDGNGRIGRAVAEKALSQSLGRSSLIALAHMIEANRKDYYAALESNNQLLEVTDWLVWFARTVLDAQGYTVKCVEFLIKKAKLYSRLGGQLNERQQKVLDRMFREGLGGFKGGLSADNYIRIARTSASTATRDLQDLVSKGALVRTGELKSTRYQLNL
jgi:Fic family protein